MSYRAWVLFRNFLVLYAVVASLLLVKAVVQRGECIANGGDYVIVGCVMPDAGGEVRP